MPLAKRYGAALLCLPLSSGDLPEKAEDRVALAESIVNRAYGYGLQPHDLLLDPLVLTLASGEDSARQTLRTLQLYKEKFWLPNSNGLVQHFLRYATTSIFEWSILNNGSCLWLNNSDYEPIKLSS